MLRTRLVVAVILTLAGLGGPAPAEPAETRRLLERTDLLELYDRLDPGMTVEEIGALVGGARLATTSEPVTAWVVWSPPVTGRPTAVLRASFRDRRLDRLEYEAFGDQYQRLVKGSGADVEIHPGELRRLWRHSWQLERAAESCEAALEAYHRLVLGLQERLSPEQQRAWVRALELRRAAEASIERAGP
jgi:hypothetical protein